MKGLSNLQVTTGLIGVSIFFISLSSYVLFIKNGILVFFIIGVAFAFLLPVIITDPRKNLRGAICCAGWWLLALGISFPYIHLEPVAVIVCLIVSLFIGLTFLATSNRLPQVAKYIRKKRHMVNVKSSQLIIICYYLFTLLAYTVGWYWKYSTIGIVICFISIALVLTIYLVYYWSWGIDIQNGSFTVTRMGNKSTHSFDNINVVLHFPLLGYYILDSDNHLICRFSLSMENTSALWIILRRKVKKIGK